MSASIMQAKRARADAGEFDDAETCQRAGGAGCGLSSGFVEHVVSTVIVNWPIKLSRLRRRVQAAFPKNRQKQNGRRIAARRIHDLLASRAINRRGYRALRHHLDQVGA